MTEAQSTLATQSRAQRALIARYTEIKPSISVDGVGRVPFAEENLVAGLPDAAWDRARRDLERGDGKELKTDPPHPPKFHSVFSSAALAVNAFARWFDSESDLAIAGRTGFSSLQFEERMPIQRGGTAPNLDVVLRSAEHVVAIESKLTEYYDPQVSSFKKSYDRPANVPALADSTWRAEYDAIKADPSRYSLLHAGQLLKHYLGIKRQVSAPATLVYLYWEPRDADGDPVCARHREEIESFATAVGGGDVAFVALSYPTLWSAWAELSDPPWLSEHVSALRARYDVELID